MGLEGGYAMQLPAAAQGLGQGPKQCPQSHASQDTPALARTCVPQQALIPPSPPSPPSPWRYLEERKEEARDQLDASAFGIYCFQKPGKYELYPQPSAVPDGRVNLCPPGAGHVVMGIGNRATRCPWRGGKMITVEKGQKK